MPSNQNSYSSPRHLLHVFATFAIGGAQVRVCDLINHFGPEFRHTIVALDGDHSCRAKLSANVDVNHVTIDYDKKKAFDSLRIFRRTLKEIKPDLLLTYNWGAIEWGLVNLFNRLCPHIHGEDGFGPDEAHGQKPRRIWARRAILARAHKIVVPSRTLERIALEIWHFPPSRVKYIPNGVDLAKYARHEIESESLSQMTDHSLIIGTVATLRKEKNIPRLVRVFLSATAKAKNFPAKLVIVGQGSEYESLRRLIEEQMIKDRVILLGQQDDPTATINTFDIFAISSDTEQMPLSVLEAMANSLPVVGTDVGDIKEMITSDNRRFLCPSSDEESFAQNLVELMTDEQLRTELGRQNRLRCEELFDKSKMFEAYRKLYNLES